MPYFASPSPTPTGGGGSTRDYDTQERSTQEQSTQERSRDELLDRIEELEAELANLREISKRREGGESRSHSSRVYSPTHTGDDGYDMQTHQRVAVLVDVQNMYYAARNLYSSKLEFSKLLQHISRGRMLTRALAYIVERPGMEQEKFVEVLRRNGYEVRKKMLIERSDGSQKGDWDLGIALDAVALADKVDTIVLVTGDGDFVTLIHHLNSRGVRVEVASFPETTALELIRSSNFYHRLNQRVLLPSGQFTPEDSSPNRSRRNHRADPAEAEDYSDDDFSL